MKRRELMLAVFVPTILLAFAQGILVLSLPILANRTSDAYTFASLIISAAAFGTLIADVPTGTLMIRLGLRTTMLLGAALVAVSTLALALPAPSEVVLALRLIAGIGTAFWGLSRYTFIAQAIPADQRGRTIASFGGVNRAGAFAGPLIAGVLIDSVGMNAAFLLAGVLASLALVAAKIWIPVEVNEATGAAVSHPGRGAIMATWDALAGLRVDVIAAGIAQMLAQLVRQGKYVLLTFYGVEIVELNASEVGLLITAAALMDFAMFAPAGFLMDRKGRKFATVPSFGLMGVGIALIPVADSFPGLLIAALLIGIGNGLGSGTMMTLGADFAPPQHTRTFLSLWRFIGDAGQVLGPVMVGVVAQTFTLGNSAWVLSACSFGCALTMLLLVSETRTFENAARTPADGEMPPNGASVRQGD